MDIPLVIAALVLRTFVQTVEAEFPDESAASQASFTAIGMPEGRRYAFSTRWDDASMRHDRMSRTLSAIGMPSTFYVNGRPSAEFSAVISNVIARGSSIGAHTITHSYLPRKTSMRLFREVLENRILLETVSQSAVSVFTLPYSSIATRADSQCAVRAGRALANAGFLGGAERNPGQCRTYGLAPERWISSNTFSIDDKNPDARKFASGYAVAKARIDSGKSLCGPHMTLGVHSWQSDEGMDRLADILRPVTARNDIWCCNENEYVAHRVQFHAAKIERLRVNGRKVEWRVERPEPYAVGAVVPLACEFSELPVRVTADGRDIAAGRSLSLAVPAAHGMPAGFVLLKGGLSADGGIVRVEFSNDTGGALEETVMTLRLPPCCEPGVLTHFAGRLERGERIVKEWRIARAEDEGCGSGFFCAVQTDAVKEGERLRFWQTFSKDGVPGAEQNCPRDRCRVAGPFAMKDVGDMLAAAEGKWRKAKSEKDDAPYSVSAVCDSKPMKNGFFLFAFDFDADVESNGEKWDVRADVPVLMRKCAFLFNGADVDVSKPVTLKDGLNNLVAVVPSDPGNWGGRLMISIASVANGAGVEYRKVDKR